MARQWTGWKRSATRNTGANNASRDREALARKIRAAEEATRGRNRQRRHECLELRRRVCLGLNDVGFIDLLSPICGRDFFECDRDRLVSVIQDIHDVFDDCVRESPLLLLGFSGPELHDHVRHCSLLYSSSLTFSIQSTALPLSCSCTAMCVTAVVGAAPCQCFSPGGIQTTSPGPISLIGPPQRCARPAPAVPIRGWPSGGVGPAGRAPGSNVTVAPSTRAGSGGREQR